MIKQEDTQFKVIALQSAQGDLEKAKEIYAWLTSDEVKAEVDRAVAQKQAQMELDFSKDVNDAL